MSDALSRLLDIVLVAVPREDCERIIKMIESHGRGELFTREQVEQRVKDALATTTTQAAVPFTFTHKDKP